MLQMTISFRKEIYMRKKKDNRLYPLKKKAREPSLFSQSDNTLNLMNDLEIIDEFEAENENENSPATFPLEERKKEKKQAFINTDDLTDNRLQRRK